MCQQVQRIGVSGIDGESLAQRHLGLGPFTGFEQEPAERELGLVGRGVIADDLPDIGDGFLRLAVGGADLGPGKANVEAGAQLFSLLDQRIGPGQVDWQGVGFGAFGLRFCFFVQA